MELSDIIRQLLGFLILAIAKLDNTGKNVTTFEPFNTTYSTVIYDPTTLTRITGNDRSESPIISSIFPSGYPTEKKLQKTTLVTGITAESEVTNIPTANSTVTNETTTKHTEPSNGTTVSHSTGGITSSGHGSTSSGHVTSSGHGSTASSHVTSSEHGSTASSHVTGGTTSSGHGSTASSHVTGGSTSSGHVTGGPTASSHVTGGSTSSGHVTGGTSQTGGSTTSDTTVAPTEKPKGLSRGAVAGIVIGCLLLIAVVAAAIVFFMKNRNTDPEHQRLRV